MRRTLPTFAGVLFATLAPAGTASAASVQLVVPQGHAGDVVGGAWSPDGDRVLTVGSAGGARLWLPSGELLRTWEADAPLTGAGWAVDGQRVAVRTEAGDYLAWDVTTGEPADESGAATWPGLAAPATTSGGRVLEWQADGVATVRADGSAVRLGGRVAQVHALEWTSAGLLHVVGDGEAMRWSGPAGRPRSVASIHHPTMAGFALGPDARRVITGDTAGPPTIWDPSGLALHELSGHAGVVSSLAWSPGGRRVASAGADGSVRLWDTASRSLVRTIIRIDAPVLKIAWSIDGSRLAVAEAGGPVWVVRSGDGHILHRLDAHPGGAIDATWSTDGQHIITGGADGRVRVWDPTTGVASHSVDGPGGPVTAVAATGTRFTAATGAGALRTWALNDAAVQTSSPAGVAPRTTLAWSPDGLTLAAGGPTGQLDIIDADGGLRRSLRDAGAIGGLDWSPAGDRLISATSSGVTVWRGRRAQRISFDGDAASVAWSPDDQRVAVGQSDGNVALLSTKRGWPTVAALQGHAGPAPAAAWGPTGDTLLTGGADGDVRTWDARSGALRAHLGHIDGGVNAVLWGPPGTWLAAGGDAGQVRLWIPTSNASLRTLDAPGPVSSLAGSAAGDLLAVGTTDGHARVWSKGFSRVFADLPPTESAIRQLAWSPDGTRLAAATEAGQAIVWDVASGAVVTTIHAADRPLTALAWSPDGALIATGAGVIRIHDSHTGVLRCTVAAGPAGEWVVFDPSGRFESGRDGDDLLNLVTGDELIALEQLRARYREPSLLARHLGWSPAPLTDVPPLQGVQRVPSVALDHPADDSRVVRVTVQDRGGGIGDVHVSLNGSDAREYLVPVTPEPDQQAWTLTLADVPYARATAPNTVRVQAFDANNVLASRGVERRYGRGAGSGDDSGDDQALPRFWAVVVGTHDYRGDTLDLDFPARDAQAMADALTLAATRLFGEHGTSVQLLTTADGNTAPTRENLGLAFAALAEARPQDVVMVYLSGHGFNYDDGTGDDYYYPTPSFSSTAELQDAVARETRTVSGKQLQRWLLASSASKRVLILDTCSSGQLIDTLGVSGRSIQAGRARAFERMRDRAGTYVLAGAAADATSYETSRYGQGVLTYALLQGLRGGALEGDNVDVATLFQFARERVPELARGVGGIQEPVYAQPGVGSFDIGLLDSADREKIVLPKERPVLVRAAFFEYGEQLQDSLAISHAIDEQLLNLSRAENATAVFFPTDDYTGAYRLTGQYLIGATGVTITARLSQDDTPVAGFLLEDVSPDAIERAAWDVAWAASSWLKQRAQPTALFGAQSGPVWILSPRDLSAAASRLVRAAEQDELPRALRWLTRTGPCAEPMYQGDLSRALGQARLSYDQGRMDRFNEAARAADGALACMAEPLSPEHIAALHRVKGLQAWSEGAHDQAVATLSVSHPDPAELERSAQPDASPEAIVLSAARADLLRFEPQLGGPLPPAARGRLSIDGQSNSAAPPLNAPYVLQRATSRRVLQTTYVAPESGRPGYARLRPRLAVAGGVSALAAAGLYVGGASLHAQLTDPADPLTEDDVDRMVTLNHVLLSASIGSAVVSAGSFTALGATWIW